MTGLLFGTLALLLVLGLPIAVSIGLTSFFILYLNQVNMIVVPQRMYSGMDSIALIAVPCFILAGDIMARGKISKYLVEFADSILGFLKGGLWIVGILASCFFASISGSAAATTAAVGAPLIPELKKKGYPETVSAAVIASAGTIGVVIPPSVPMVIYATTAAVSLNKMFLNGFIPGLGMGIALIVIATFVARKLGLPAGQRVDYKNVVRSFKNAFWGILSPVIILGGIFSGIFTPTEAAVIAVDYSLIVEFFIYKDLTVKDLKPLLVNAAITTSIIMFLIGISSPFAWIFANYRIPESIASAVLGLTGNTYLLLFLMTLIVLAAGCFMETSPAIILLTPIFIPLLKEMGVSLVHFGVVMVIGLAIGMITPPVAVCLNVASSITDIPLFAIARKIVPFLISLIVLLLIYLYLPVLFPVLVLG